MATDKRGGYRAKARRPLAGESRRVTTSINIEERLLDKLDGLAASTGETRSDIINRLLRIEVKRSRSQ
jgi:metal-responsive CopG/Arc/MetJ family transcriptional regulator